MVCFTIFSPRHVQPTVQLNVRVNSFLTGHQHIVGCSVLGYSMLLSVRTKLERDNNTVNVLTINSVSATSDNSELLIPLESASE